MSINWKNALESIEQSFQKALVDVESALTTSADVQGQVNALQAEYLAKKGKIAGLMRQLQQVENDQRPEFGKHVNLFKERAQEKVFALQVLLDHKAQNRKLHQDQIDVTLPGRMPQVGCAHPIRATIDRAMEVLRELGFTLQLAPEMDNEYYMFDALNFPKDHPARDMQDTFYLADDLLLRSHTTNAQVRLLEAFGAPLRAAVSGQVFRNEEVSARSLVAFHQIDVLVVDRDVTYADLIDHLEIFLNRFFGKKIEMRTRLSYFPFVQPGIEVDIRCPLCPGSGCSVCKKSGWIEICGAGMVHPQILKNGGIDPESYTGFAWGLGVERLVMLAFGIRDIRQFVQNDARFLQQFCKL